ncbi:MAG: SurA N-terminal domain-containing protein [Deltaproteobacteria bacterium]|nr:SurA N-terminal domain-containing protein [Deltaproteobacteria bacterium]
MLEQMRQQSRSLIIYVLFGIVIAVFIVNFGPQSPTSCGGRGGQGALEGARVKGRLLTQQDYMYGMMMVGAQNIPPQRAKMMRLHETVMDMLIDREIMASEAERAGFRVSDEEVEDFIGESQRIIALGREQKMSFFERDGKVSYDNFRKFVQYQLGMTPRSFIEEQRREMLANRMRESLRAGVAVSPEEVKEEWIREADQANVEYLRFPVHRYESELELRSEEIARYAAANAEALKQLYDQRKAALYEKQPKQRRLRQILVKLEAEPTETDLAAAQKKADSLAARIRKGEAFAKVAKADSQDERTRARGGDLGWQRVGGTMLDPAVDAKLAAAKDGELVGPIKTPSGFVLAIAEATREGDIEFDAAKLELAEGKLREEKSRAQAKAAADAALAKSKAAPAKTLEDLYPAPEEEQETVASGPRVEETGLFSRHGSTVPGIGKAPALAKAIFALTTEAPLAGPIEELGSFIVVKLKERKEPDMAEFEKHKVGLMADAAKRKGSLVVMEWALARCREARDAKQIEVNTDLLRYEGGPEGAIQYEPCTPPQMH